VTCGVAGIRGNERLECCPDLIVGDDGVNSFVRSSLGIPIDLRAFPIDFITAAVRWAQNQCLGQAVRILFAHRQPKGAGIRKRDYLSS
jgi:2-polyprenyl-6-methoxyphenol hydroxylase-like FAD-dependent oxidoreductase